MASWRLIGLQKLAIGALIVWEALAFGLRTLHAFVEKTALPEEVSDALKTLAAAARPITALPAAAFWALVIAPPMFAVIALRLAPRVEGGKELHDPRPEWIPLKHAPFVVARMEPFQTARRFQPELFLDHALAGRSIDLPPKRLNMLFNPAVPEAKLVANGSDLVFCGVDWEKRNFAWEWETDGPRPRVFGVRIYPTQIDRMRSTLLHVVTPEACEYMCDRVRFTWALMTHPIDDLIAEGALEVWGREGAVTAPFRRIPADAWRHYTQVDWQEGKATTPEAAPLYSIFVAPTARKVRTREVTGLRGLFLELVKPS
jgi:hypothetical protein